MFSFLRCTAKRHADTRIAHRAAQTQSSVQMNEYLSLVSSWGKPVEGEVDSVTQAKRMVMMRIREIGEEGSTCLDLSGLSVTSLPPLPAHLVTLTLNGCRLLTGLPPLPVGLTHLYLRGCRSVKVLPSLPYGLKYLDVSGCSQLTLLTDKPNGVLPPHLIGLEMRDCPALRQLPDSLPSCLRYIIMNNCPSVIGLPSSLPPELKYLFMVGCPLVTVLPRARPDDALIIGFKPGPTATIL